MVYLRKPTQMRITEIVSSFKTHSLAAGSSFLFDFPQQINADRTQVYPLSCLTPPEKVLVPEVWKPRQTYIMTLYALRQITDAELESNSDVKQEVWEEMEIRLLKIINLVLRDREDNFGGDFQLMNCEISYSHEAFNDSTWGSKAELTIFTLTDCAFNS